MITNWDQVPLIADHQFVGDLIGVHSYDGVKRAIKSGDLPEPTMERPMRWSKADLMRHWRFPVVELKARAPEAKAS